MSEENITASSTETEQQQPISITMQAFLTSMPPSDGYTHVKDVLVADKSSYQIFVPSILLHCTSEICKGGNRVYRYLKGPAAWIASGSAYVFWTDRHASASLLDR
jgi:hypothetical protein